MKASPSVLFSFYSCLRHTIIKLLSTSVPFALLETTLSEYLRRSPLWDTSSHKCMYKLFNRTYLLRDRNHFPERLLCICFWILFKGSYSYSCIKFKRQLFALCLLFKRSLSVLLLILLHMSSISSTANPSIKRQRNSRQA